MSAQSTNSRRPNRLIHEKSPYLLQHAYNPVDWFPWGAEAFAKSAAEDKPIFLSIGYSTCYWCHVMEVESFDNPAVAAAINEQFVPIKVDREERPDIDSLYMNAVMAMTGQGGWPMTVFLTPDGHPFWGGTYFPPEDRGGRPGLLTVLRSLQTAWRTRRDELVRSSQSLTQTLQASAGAGGAGSLTRSTLEVALEQYTQQYDATDGGFGPAPKFPRSHSLSLLLRLWARSRDPHTLEMVEHTLDAMARGGIHDQVGGGFHRYSTDAHWLVPHFEKMLYDQALLAIVYLEAYQATGKSQYADTARDICDYVLRDLRDAGGGFYSAEDAGEVGKEGEFYVWTQDELAHLLDADEWRLVQQVYGVSAEGNFEHQTNILHRVDPLQAGQPESRLATVRAKLLVARSQRPRPYRDDKILTDWNGLMIAALAYGGRVLEEPRYTQAAEQAATFVLEQLRRVDNQPPRPFDSAQGRGERAERVEPRLLHRWRDGAADIPAFLDDHVFLSWGVFELYETTFDPRWLAESTQLLRAAIAQFWDAAHGGFFMTGSDQPPLIARTKELYDGAVPSGNSVAALMLVRLGTLTMDQSVQQTTERLFAAFSGQVSQAPQAFPQCLIAVDLWLGPPQEIVIAGDPTQPQTQRMLRDIQRSFLPRAIVVLHPTGAPAAGIEQLAPFVAAQQPIAGQPAAYICERYVCHLPLTDVEQIRAALAALR